MKQLVSDKILLAVLPNKLMGITQFMLIHKMLSDNIKSHKVLEQRMALHYNTLTDFNIKIPVPHHKHTWFVFHTQTALTQKN